MMPAGITDQHFPEVKSMFAQCRRSVVLSVAVIVAAGSAACGDGPTRPSPAASAGPAVPVRLQIVVPQQLAPGESVQLTANAVNSDGSVANATNQVRWTVGSMSAGDVLALTGPAVVTGGTHGRAVVSGRVGDLTDDATIFVLPSGTFRVAGRITAAGAAVPDVAVSVVGGVGSGLTTHTDRSGDYELYGVSGPVDIRAAREGYFDRIEQADVSTHRTLSFELSTLSAVNYEGTYTLTIHARSCSSTVPDEVKVRSYRANVQQTGAKVQVFLSGADFLRRSDAFTGQVGANGSIRFVIEPASAWDYGQPGLEERLPDGTILLVHGVIEATTKGTGIVGTAPQQTGGLGGIYHLPPRGFSWSLDDATGRCDIDRFEMVRQ
jgi:hypothetical protein